MSFVDQVAQTVTQRDVMVPIGGSGWDQRLTLACHNDASDYGYTHWVQPYRKTSASPVEWLVFGLAGRLRRYCRTLPTREAAEMWVLHHEQ